MQVVTSEASGLSEKDFDTQRHLHTIRILNFLCRPSHTRSLVPIQNRISVANYQYLRMSALAGVPTKTPKGITFVLVLKHMPVCSILWLLSH